MRANRMTEDILKIAKIAKIDQAKIDDLEDLFKDFKDKNQKRNQCLHWIWESSREVKAPVYKSSQTIPYTPESVNELADDLIWIEVRLTSHVRSDQELLNERAK